MPLIYCNKIVPCVKTQNDLVCVERALNPFLSLYFTKTVSAIERLRVRKPIIEKVVTRKPLSDIFIELDPYSLSDKPDKNIGKGKVLKTPAELKDDDDTNRKRKRKPVPEKPKVPLSVFIQKSCFSHHEKYTKTVFNTPTFEALENQFWKEFVRRKQIWTKEKKLIKSVNSKQLEEFEDREIEIPDADEFGGGEDDVDDDVVDNGLEAAPAFDISVGHERDMIHNFTFNRDELTSYEELARQHIERFMACGNYFHTTEIAQKVAEWEEKILPRLEAEEHRPAFDIHQYGSQILDELTVKTRVKFAHIAAGKPDHEICRLFSSLLQLVNAGNIQIHKHENFLKAMDEFELELLSMVRHHEELANKQYDAPSQSNSGEAISV
ncbi:condensin-2 complex subunit H2 isoform X2 [Patella vulgata]|uniref:condensin-2 complex subunit H2 isoform X2 n=1 Tax=Patella vulgata TaxID=6465 RepID=UPI0021800ED0|nr:condensin-2 complex subunit H2 isoform X2 [Patella vulgata]